MDDAIKEELSRACMLGDLDTMMFLYEMHSEADDHDQQEIIDQIIDFEFGMFEGTVLMEAAYYNKPKIVRFLIHSGADIDKQTNSGETALMIAAREGHLDMVAMLVEVGADPNLQNDQGVTALSIALSLGQMHIVELLCDNHGANINITYFEGGSAVLTAAYRGNIHALKSLVARGAIVDDLFDEKRICTVGGKSIKHKIAEIFSEAIASR